MVFQVRPGRSRPDPGDLDFFFESAGDPGPPRSRRSRYIDEVLQQQDIAIVESVQRRHERRPLFIRGGSCTTRKARDPGSPSTASTTSTVCVLDAYRRGLDAGQRATGGVAPMPASPSSSRVHPPAASTPRRCRRTCRSRPRRSRTASIEAAEAGAAIIHLHARNPETGQPDPRPELFHASSCRRSPRGCDAVHERLDRRWPRA